MTDYEPENLVLIYLRRLSTEVGALRGDVQELGRRVTSLAFGGSALRRDIAHLFELDAQKSDRFDRIEARLDRVERRLDLR